jgi:hypothetical protein
MRDICRTSWRSLGVAAALALGLATAVLTVPSASAASAGGRGRAGRISPRITFYFGLRRPEARADLQRQHLPPVGPADGLFYYLARCRPGALWDVVKGNNSFFKKVPARHARPGYDLASGLGVPQFAQVAQLIPSAGGAVSGDCPTISGAG